MGKLFGTDGVRGIANKNLDCLLAYKIGQAGAYVLSKGKTEKTKILIGQDTRISGNMLEAALVAGACSVGAVVYRANVLPTPAVAFLTRTEGFDAGIVVSASHNSAEFNGIKFFNSQGYKLNDEIEDEIESYILEEKEIELPIGENIGSAYDYSDAYKKYVDFAMSTLDIRLDGLKIALDCANGASYKTSPEVFKRLGADVKVIHNTPDGININYNCGSTHIESLQEYVVKEKCDLGFAFDGDADRVLAVDHLGNLFDGDKILAVCAMNLKKEGKLKNDTIVATVMSNLGLLIMGKDNGINVLQSKVGDKYVLEDMLKGGYILGGEQSGHVIFLEYNTTGDGLATALQIAKAVVSSKKTLNELGKIVNILPQVLLNARVSKSNDTSYQEIPEIMSAIADLEAKFSGKGRVLIRPSGTEPLVRVMIEGENQEELEQYAKELVDLIESKCK